MDIRALGYIGVDVADTAEWRAYAETLGTMVRPTGDDRDFEIKIDDRPFRIAVQHSESAEGLAFAGWELRDAAGLDEAAAELEAAGFEVRPSTAEERTARKVRGMVKTTDPGGFALELFYGPIHDHELFVSPTGVSGFATGDMGLGHIVVGTADLGGCVDFYTRVMGFRVSDYMGAGADDVVFTRCNPRHHSLALVAAPEPVLYHFMVEALTLDDVGYTLHRFESRGLPLSMGLGRHTNDMMVSFYSRSPSAFDVEFGCGGIRVDEATWAVSEVTKPSLWGHRRVLAP
ncbi:MAG: VOC family protein [Acidimicrobiia bacterium]|nr:VOC family protein [Acidimicrobiia bacterium]